MIDGLALTIDIGADTVPGWLPLMPQRFALEGAYRSALGFGDGDAGIPTGAHSEADFGAVLCAAVALCWGGPPLELILHTDKGPTVVSVPPGPGGLQRFGRDLIAFGDAACDALMRRGYGHEAMYSAGRDCRQAMLDSIPRQSEVDEAADFTEGPAVASTPPTSK